MVEDKCVAIVRIGPGTLLMLWTDMLASYWL
jgi:hypothetical protein